MATRWHPDNGHLQCMECNGLDDDEKYEESLIKKIGEEKVEELKWLSRHEVKYTKSDLELIEDELKKLIHEQTI